MEERLDDDSTLKKRLLGRILFAMAVLAALIGSLIAYDHVNAPVAPELVARRAEPPAAAAPQQQPAAPVDLIKSVAADAAGTAQTAEPGEGKPAVAQVPEESTSPKVAGEGKPLTRPATARHALMRDPGAAGSAPPAAAAANREAPAPAAQAARQPATPARPVSSQSRPFTLQLGVFSDVANAEELRTRLEKAGVRASIEARVHVGPFATRAEADKARAKLRELGIADAILLSRSPRKAQNE